MNVNVVAINDGFAPELKRALPNYKGVHYYPTILLYKNDASNTVIEFNPEHAENDKYAFNSVGMMNFLEDNGAYKKKK